MSVYKASLYNYLFNSINSIVVIINGILLVPLYFHYMPVSVYGAWLASGNLMAMIGMFSGGFSGVITQKMAAAISQEKKKDFLELAGANIMTACLIASLFFLASMVLAPFVADIVNVESEYANDIHTAFLVSAVSSVISVFTSLCAAYAQVWQVTRAVGIISVSVNLAGIATTIISLLSGCGVVSLALGYLVRSSTNLLLLGGWTLKYWRTHEPSKPIFRLRTIPYLMKESVFPFVSNVCRVLMYQSQSLILAGFLSPALAAIYDITGKVAACLYNFISMANGSFFALLSLTFGKGNTKESNRVAGTIIQYYSIIITAIVVFSVLFSKPIIHFWVGLDKYGGDFLLLMMVLSTGVGQYKSVMNDILFSGGQISRSARYDIFSMVIYLGLLFGSIQILNEYALPLSMLITNLFFLVVYMLFIRKYLGLDTPRISRIIIKNTCITVPFVLAHFIIPTNPANLWLQIILLAITSVSVFCLLMTLNKDTRHTLQVKLPVLRFFRRS